MSRTTNFRLSTGIAALVAIAASHTTHAQLEEVVVTARKTAENLQDVPASITAIGSTQLEREGVSDIKDVARLTPGLIFDLGFVPQDSRPQIRGLPATRGKPPVGILIDNIDVSSESIQTAGGGMIGNVRLMDLERIEVVKGPQSVLYGRAAFGGAINYVTAKPSLDGGFVKFNAEVGQYGRAEARMIANGALSDTVAVRGSVSYAQHDGFYRNSISGSKVGGFDSKGGTLAALWQPNDDFRLNARIAVSDDHFEPRAQVAYGFGTGLSQAYPVPSPYVGICLGLLPAGFSTAAQTTCPTGSAQVAANGFATRTGEIGGFTTVTLSLDPLTGRDYEGTTLESTVGAVNFDWDVAMGTLTSWTGVARAKSRSRQDVDSYGAAATAVTQPSAGTAEALNYSQVVDLDTTTKQLSQELRLASDGSAQLRWSIGAQYGKEEIDQLNYGYTSSTIAGRSVARAVQMIGAPPSAGTDVKETTHKGYYGSLEFDFTEKLTARVEARYNDEDFTYTWLSPARGIAYAPTTANPTASATNPQWTPAVSVTNTSSFTATTPRASVTFKATDDVMIYGSVGKGFKAGGFVTLAGTPIDFAKFEPEKLLSYELGVKSKLLGGNLVLNGNVFFMENTNKLFTTLEPDVRSITGTSLRASNNSDAESKGVELEAQLAVGDYLRLSALYTYTNAKYTRFAPITTGTLGIAVAGNCTIGEVAAAPNPTTGAARVLRFCSTSNAGIPLERSAKHSGALTATWERPIGNGELNLLIDGSLQYMGERPEQASLAGIVFGAYTNIDLRVGVTSKGWSAYAYAENLTGDDTIRSGQAGGDFARAGNQLIGAYLPDKRQLGVRVSYEF
jgi:outer membrane receptor protein involved in Fe transport